MVAIWYMRSILPRASGSLRAQTFSLSTDRKNWTSHLHHMIFGSCLRNGRFGAAEAKRHTIIMIIYPGQALDSPSGPAAAIDTQTTHS